MTWVDRLLQFAQLLAAAAAAVGLLLTWQQLGETRKAYEQSIATLQANTIYQIQKDGRELLSALTTDRETFRYIFQHNVSQTYAPDVKERADLRIALLLNFYASIVNQREAGAVGNSLWTSFRREFCVFLKNAPVKSLWDSRVSSGAYNPAFVREGSTC